MLTINRLAGRVLVLGALLLICLPLACAQQPAALTMAEAISCIQDGEVQHAVINAGQGELRGEFREGSQAQQKYGLQNFSASFEAEYASDLEGILTKNSVPYELIK